MKELARRLIRLTLQRNSLKSDIKAVEEEIATVNTRLADRFRDQGMKSMKLETGTTIHLRDNLYARAKAGQSEMLCMALREEGMDWAVSETCLTSALKGWIKEQIQERADNGGARSNDDLKPQSVLPDGVQQYIEVYEEAKCVVLGAEKSRDTLEGDAT